MVVTVNVLLADLDEAAARREQGKAAGQRLTSQRIEYHVHTTAAGKFHDLVGEP